MHVIPRLLVLAAVLAAVSASVLDSRLQLLLAAHKLQSTGGGAKGTPDHASDIHVIAGSAHNTHTVQGLLAAMAALEFGNTRSAGNAGNAGIEDPLEAQAKAEDLFWADEGVEKSDADSKATLDAVRGHAVFVDEGGAVGAKVMGVRDSADDSLLHDLRARGFVIPEYYNNRKVFTARAPLAALASINSLKSASALRLSLGTPLAPVLDTSVPELYGFPHRTMKNYPLDGSKTGAGVIFGVIDTGVDIGHPNFNNHVTRYWHQPANALGDAIEICTFYCCGCTESHGTHVTATAAGQYGVAPAAEIRAVESTMVNTDILDGVNWLIAEAQQDNKSIVINLSLGTVVGVMDGQDTLDVGISEAVRGGSSSLLPGVVVVVAAGNEADANHMFTHTFTRENEDIVITAVVEPYQPTFDSSMFIVHFIGPLNDAFALQLGTPLGITFDFGTIPNQQVGCALADFSLGSAILCPEGAVRDNLQLFWMAITTNVTDVDFGILVGSWQFNITPSAFDNTVDNHLFTARIVSTTSNLNVQLANATKEMTLTSPGTSEDVITVAAYDTKWKWKALLYNRTLDTNRDGDLSYCELGWDLTDNKTGCSPERDIYGELCSFSSRGPTRDNRTKPEVAAPGGGIAAAVSRFQFTLGNVYSANQTTADWERGVYQIMQGTSMACPHVAGAIAVLLQRNSSLTVDDARTLLEKSAIPPTTSAVDENGPYAWGAGKVNATAAIARQTRKPAHTPKPKPSKKPKLEPVLEDTHRPSTWSNKLGALWKWV